MANTFVEDFKKQFRNGNVTAQLIIINIIVFLSANILLSVSNIGIIHYLMLPSSFGDFLFQPWSIISYMFLHTDFTHILMNMLWLYWMGKIFSDYLGASKLLSLYLASGIAGGLLFMIISQLTSSSSYLLGASASVMGIVIAIAVYVPNFVIHLMFFGPVKLKYVALVSFILTSVLDLSINTGGKIAHIGGAFLGFLYIAQLKKGNDFLRFFHGIPLIFKNLFSHKRQSKVKVAYKRPISDHEYNTIRADKQKQVDDILDKIKKSGYESLSKEEKDFLFRQSNDKN